MYISSRIHVHMCICSGSHGKNCAETVVSSADTSTKDKRRSQNNGGPQKAPSSKHVGICVCEMK